MFLWHRLSYRSTDKLRVCDQHSRFNQNERWQRTHTHTRMLDAFISEQERTKARKKKVERMTKFQHHNANAITNTPRCLLVFYILLLLFFALSLAGFHSPHGFRSKSRNFSVCRQMYHIIDRETLTISQHVVHGI